MIQDGAFACKLGCVETQLACCNACQDMPSPERPLDMLLQGELGVHHQYQAPVSYGLQHNTAAWDTPSLVDQAPGDSHALTNNLVQDPQPQLLEQPSADTT